MKAGSPVVPQGAHLRTQAALQKNVQIAVAVKIRGGESAAVLRKVDARNTGNVVIAFAAAGIHHVRLAAVPAIVFTDELVNCVPAVLVGRRRGGRSRRVGHNLAPKEAHHVRGGSVGQHAAGTVDLGRTV